RGAMKERARVMIPCGEWAPPPFAGLPRWVLSDTHFAHRNIVLAGRRPPEHEEWVLARWRALVAPEEVVLHLGDVAYGTRAEVEALLPRLAALPGRVYVIRGNHDERPKLRLYERIGWRVVAPFALAYRGWRVAFRHKPCGPLPPATLLVHGHLHGAPDRSPRYLNVSVERLDYRPADLAALLEARIEGLLANSLA
ncbi:MAG TPA: metallophosphoesterase, partial [Ktedonobacterales bacterium]